LADQLCQRVSPRHHTLNSQPSTAAMAGNWSLTRSSTPGRQQSSRAYARWFDHKAMLAPKFRFVEAPSQVPCPKLRRCPAANHPQGGPARIVQLLKRDRDIYFSRTRTWLDLNHSDHPCGESLRRNVFWATWYDSEIDLLLDVVRVMPGTSEWSRSLESYGIQFLTRQPLGKILPTS